MIWQRCWLITKILDVNDRDGFGIPLAGANDDQAIWIGLLLGLCDQGNG